MDDLLDFHARHGYCIRVQPLKDGKALGCFAEFPKTSDKKPFVLAYVFENGLLKVIMEKEGNQGDMKSLALPDYALRAVVLEDIVCAAKKVGLTDKLIYWTKNNRKSQLSEIVSIDQESLAKEKTLLNVITNDENFSGKNSQFAKEVGVFEGYEIFNKVRTNGGICNV